MASGWLAVGCVPPRAHWETLVPPRGGALLAAAENHRRWVAVALRLTAIQRTSADSFARVL